MTPVSHRSLIVGSVIAVVLTGGAALAFVPADPAEIKSPAGDAKATAIKPSTLATFDLVQTAVRREGTKLVFIERVSGRAGAARPTRIGKLAGSDVYSYVWPTSLDPAAVGFEGKAGTLALAATVHPDFDDTPKFDENGDGDPANDGDLWHSHWVVLVPDDACGKGALKVRDIPAGAKPALPATWPGLPIYIDSPGYEPEIAGPTIRVSVPLKDVGFPASFAFDGVTAALRVNASVHDPLLCVADVFDIASRSLTLPGKIEVGGAGAKR
ncbi:MAG: hypothetical protein ACOVSI_11555 [Gemmatimonas sp.]|jgi:hypothetical protein